MDIASQDLDGVRILRVLAPRVDAAEAVLFKDAVRDAAEGGPPRIVLDMTDVNFLDSSGLGAVIGSMKMLAPGQTLELACLHPAVDKVLRLTRMDTIIRIHATLPLPATPPDARPGPIHAV